jgi:ABC-type multidrug transport system ATPase subunit
MTVEEHLKFFVQLKGIPIDFRVDLVEDSIKQLGL